MLVCTRFRDATFVCDGQCHKAWGRNSRPRLQLSPDVDDYMWLPDGELPIAPFDPGTYEGDDAKPFSHGDEAHADGMNKWCARECERAIVFYKELGKTGDPAPALPDFSRPQFNFRSRQEDYARHRLA